jgi:hypothetical protein
MGNNFICLFNFLVMWCLIKCYSFLSIYLAKFEEISHIFIFQILSTLSSCRQLWRLFKWKIRFSTNSFQRKKEYVTKYIHIYTYIYIGGHKKNHLFEVVHISMLAPWCGASLFNMIQFTIFKGEWCNKIGW